MSRIRVTSPALPVFTITFSNSLDVGQPALQIDGVLEIHPRRRRRRADLARRDVLALLLQRLNHVLGVEASRLELVRVEPDAHRVLAGAENVDFADAGQTRQLVPDVIVA